MKKFLQLSLITASLLLGTIGFAQSSGIFESYAIVSINGGANAYYDMQAATANADFNGANLGTFSSVSTLVMKGGENKTYKNGGCNINSSTFSYRVYLTSGGPSGTFVNINEAYNGELGGGDQSWLGTSGAFNALSGLAAGNYTIEAYSTANFDSCGTGTHFSSNSGANYKATFTINPILVTATAGTSLSATYPTLAAAVTAINTVGLHSGTVVCFVNAGYSETAPAGGYAITATGTLGNTITFQKSGVGANPTFTAPAQTSPSLTDAIFKIIGGDYITIDGFTLLERNFTPVAADTTAGTNTMTEFGVALFYATSTNGAQNNTIKNCTIDLNRTYTNTYGIYSNSSTTATNMGTAAAATTATGANSNLTIIANTITDVNQGIVVIGSPLAVDQNDGLVIGGSIANANTITNYGTAAAASNFNLVSGTMNGILVRNTKNFTISNNTITSSTAVTVGNVRGIFVTTFSNAPTGTLVHNINNNNISVKSASATGILQGIIVEATTANATTTLNINANDFNNFGHTVVSSGVITFINNLAVVLTSNINNNTFTNVSVNTTNSVIFISNSITIPTGGSQNINSNAIVTAFNKTGAGGTVTFISSAASSLTGSTSLWNLNNFSNITVTGATTIAGITSTDGGTINHNITNNTITNITGGTSAITAITSSFGGGGGSLGNVVSGNTINTISSAGAITGIAIGTSGTISNVFNNNINGLISTGAFAVQGITSGAPTSNSIYQNKIYNLEANNASGSVNGVTVSAGTLHTIYNNVIGDLRTPAANLATAIAGINIAGGTTSNVYHNSVILNATSAGALFGTSAIFASSASNVTLRNNIFINNSTPMGAIGFAAAYRRGGLLTVANYPTTSDNNIFYAGTPSANNVIFYDNTTVRSTLADYKTFVATRDIASQTENVAFISTAGSNADFLRIAAATLTFAESGASLVTVPLINSDYWNVTRPFVAPVNGGTAVDIGASEFDGIPALVNCVAPIDQATAYIAGATTSSSATATFTAAASVPTGYLVITSQGAFVGTPVNGTVYSFGAVIGNGLVLQSSASTTINAVGLPSNTVGTITIIAYNSGACAGGPKYNLVSPLTGTNTTCAGAPTLPVTNGVSASGFTANWTANVGGNAFPLTFSVEVTTDAAYTLPIVGSPFTATSASLVVSGLNPATTYYWRVRANNSVCDSAYLSGGSVTTPCLPISTFPWIESISTTGTPICFTANESVAGASQHWTGVTADATHGAATAAAGTHFVSLNVFNASVTFNTYNLALPAFVLDSAPKQFKYSHWLGLNGSATPLLVEISTDGGTVWTTLFTHAAGTSAWLNNTINLSSYSNQTIIIRFKATSNFGSAFCNQGLDEFIVENIPTPISVSSSAAICAGDATTLTVSSANTNYTYTWSPALGLNTTSGASVIATPTTTTIYTVTAVDGSMNNSGTVTVIVNAKPSVSTLGSNSPVCEGDTLNLTNTPVVLPGYSLNSNSGVAFVDIATSGTSVGTVADDSEHNITIPSFTFNGVPYTNARIGNNGVLVFGTTTGDIIYTNSALPQGIASSATATSGIITGAGNSLAAILANWDDMTTSATAGLTKITTQTVGGLYIIQWTSEDNFGATGTGTVTFQIQLETATGKINLVYPDITYGAVGFDNGQSATIGLNYSATSALQYSLNTASLVDGQSLTFTPNTVNYSWAGPNSFTSTSQNPVIPAVTSAAAGTYTLTVTNPVTGCFSTSTTNVILKPNTTIATQPVSQTVCTGESVTFTVVGANSATFLYEWKQDGVAIAGADQASYIATLAGNYTVDVVGDCGPAVTSDVATLTLTPLTVPTFTAIAPVCAGSTVAALPTTSLNGITGTWSPAIDTTVTTTYTFTPTSGQCADVATLVIAVGTTTTWTAGTPNFWDNGVPTSTSSAVIATNYSEVADITACTLTVNNNAIVTIPSANNVTLNGVLTVATGSTFTLSDSSNLIQSSDVTNIGDIIVNRTTPALMRLDYVLWSSPVANQNLLAFSPSTLVNRFYTYNPSSTYYETVVPSTTSFGEGSGYLIRLRNNHPTTPTTWTGTFTGVPNNGPVGLSVANGTYNAIGNPYPSAINANAFMLANNSTALYFWRKSNNAAASTSYATYTTAGGVANSGFDPLGLIPNGNIQVGQGFLVQATSTSLNFTNDMRVSASGPFLRMTENRNRVWLDMTSSEGLFTQTMISYMPNATSGIDTAIDGRLLSDENASTFSSLINNEEFAIQGRSLPFEATDVVPMAFKSSIAGSYTISTNHVDGLFDTNAQAVYLQDNLTNTVHNLASPYTFVTDSGVFNSRFQIVYQPSGTLATTNPLFSENNVIVYKQEENVVINTGKVDMDNVKIFDIRGRLLIEKSNINTSNIKLNTGTTNQVLIVKITSKTNEVVTKKIIN